MSVRSLLRWVPVLLLLVFGTGAWAQTVTTDKSDYAPGETAQITGSGFHANETVTLEVEHIDSTPGGGAGHEAWTVTTNASGSFTSSWYVHPDDSLGSTFKLTADCAHGLHAETTFTDNLKIDSVSPSSGPTSGGTLVTIKGGGYGTSGEPYKVTFGTAASVTATRVDGETLTATTPAHAAATVDVKVSDKDGKSTATKTGGFTYTSTSTNAAPVANNDSYSVNEDNTLTVPAAGVAGVLANDTDADGNSLTAIKVSGPANGTLTLNANGSFTYTPGANYRGTDSFTYKANDGTLDSNTATVTITVNPVNDAPTANAGGPYSGNEGSQITFTGSGSDMDAGDTLTYSWNFGDGSPATAFSSSPSAARAYADNGTYTATLTVKDSAGATGTSSATVTVANVTPTAAINGAPASSPEGTAISLTSTVTDPGTADTHSYAWSVTKNGNAFASGSGASYSFTPDDNGTYVVTLTVTDDDGGTGTTTKTIDVTNVAPTVVINGAPASSPEGRVINLTSSVTDPSSADTAAGFDYAWSVTKNGTTYASGTTAGFNFSPDDNGTYVVTLRVTDKDRGAGTDSKTITVTNVAPTATFMAPSAVNEGSNISLSLTNPSDPSSADTTAGFTYAFDGGSGYGAWGSSSTATFPTSDNGSRTLQGKIRDKDGGVTEYTATVTVANVAPTVTITGPASGYVAAVNTAVNLTGTFTDPGTADTHTTPGTQWSFSGDVYGNPDPVPGTVTETNGSGSVSGSKSFTAAGVYAIRLTVTDDDNGSGSTNTIRTDGTDLPAFVVIYDPSAGFVTGGGWINSPAGAYAADPYLTGKASFGFVSRYQRGATVPTGNTEFQFKAGNLMFKSASYEWLVVSGARAQFKGQGTINGAGGYRFMLTAIDGQINGGGGSDKFRIKIWVINANGSDGRTVYDNQMGADDNATPSTVIGGGSIVIHAN